MGIKNHKLFPKETQAFFISATTTSSVAKIKKITTTIAQKEKTSEFKVVALQITCASNTKQVSKFFGEVFSTMDCHSRNPYEKTENFSYICPSGFSVWQIGRLKDLCFDDQISPGCFDQLVGNNYSLEEYKKLANYNSNQLSSDEDDDYDDLSSEGEEEKEEEEKEGKTKDNKKSQCIIL